MDGVDDRPLTAEEIREIQAEFKQRLADPAYQRHLKETDLKAADLLRRYNP